MEDIRSYNLDLDETIRDREEADRDGEHDRHVRRRRRQARRATRVTGRATTRFAGTRIRLTWMTPFG